MEIAILVFFLAIFGGVLFLLGLIWYFFIRKRNARRQNRSFSSSGSANQDSDSSDDDNETDFADTSSEIYSDNSVYADSQTENLNSEGAAVERVEAEYSTQSENYHHTNHSDASASAEPSYNESSSSSYDSGSSSDSSSSYDSGSSDSGSSSSSD